MQAKFLCCSAANCHWLVLGSTCVEQQQVSPPHSDRPVQNAACGPVRETFTHNPPLCLTPDLALRCLLEPQRHRDETEPTLRCPPAVLAAPGPVLGLAVALCCHHRCEWRHYVGRQFFAQRGLGAAEFSAFCRMSSWATCGLREGRKDGTGDHEEQDVAEETESVSR